MHKRSRGAYLCQVRAARKSGRRSPTFIKILVCFSPVSNLFTLKEDFFHLKSFLFRLLITLSILFNTLSFCFEMFLASSNTFGKVHPTPLKKTQTLKKNHWTKNPPLNRLAPLPPFTTAVGNASKAEAGCDCNGISWTRPSKPSRSHLRTGMKEALSPNSQTVC